MFNAEKPNLEDLPSSFQLIRSTILALAAAIVVLFTVILPAEYAIDPTGIGRTLGLTEMGEIKKELHDEAEQDHNDKVGSNDQFSPLSFLASLFIGTAHAQSATNWKDEITFTLAPGDTYEAKLTMNKGDVAEYVLIVEGGRVNFDLHAHGGGQSITYEKGRGSTGSEGQLKAAFNGNHGWFWRNRDKKDVTISLKVRGTYNELKKGNGSVKVNSSFHQSTNRPHLSSA